MDRAVEAARKAFYETDWAQRPVEERAEMCERLAALIAEHREEFRDLIVDELGHTKFLVDVYHSVAPTLHWNYYAKLGRNFKFAEVREADLGPLAGNAGGLIMKYETKSLVVREPVGVVAVLCAFNFPLPGIAQKTAPALVAGLHRRRQGARPRPAGHLRHGRPRLAGRLPARSAEHRRHRCGGLGASGQPPRRGHGHLHRLDGGRQEDRRHLRPAVKPCVLELGGKSAAIILDDADLDAILPTVAGVSAGTSQGESCVCMSRILAPRSRYDEIAAKLTEAFAAMKVGDPFEEDTIVGPLISKAHRERVLDFVEKAVEEGATVATGGKAPEHLDKGWYFEPTLLTNVSNDMTVAQEEVFGPVIALIAYDDEEDAIRIANDSRFGLAGCVFTSDSVRGFAIARRVRSGTFSVNTFAADFNSPFGGYKESGIGREHGPTAIEEYLLYKTISVDPSDELPEEVVRSVERTPAPV